MRLFLALFLSLLVCLSAPVALHVQNNNSKLGLHVLIYVHTPLPGNRSYRGYNVSISLGIYNGFEEPVNISVDPNLSPMELVWSNYTSAVLGPGSSIRFTWIVYVPCIGFGNYTLGFNISYILNSTTYSVYKEAWIEVIPRNVSLITADLYHNGTGYSLVITNPLIDPGQYIIENISIAIETYNVTVEPEEVFIDRLYVNNSYTIPLTISFNGSDIGALLVNITTRDDVHGLVYFNYTFIVFNATAYLDLYVINDYGEPLSRATVTIANGTYVTDSNGMVSLVLPVGIYNYTVKYFGHSVSGKIPVYTGHNTYTIVVDVSSPVIASVEQRGYGLVVEAYDPGINASGVALIKIVQGDRVWSYRVYPRHNVTAILYPPMETGEITIEVVDAQGNTVNTCYYYEKPERTSYLHEALLVLLISGLAIITMLLLMKE